MHRLVISQWHCQGRQRRWEDQEMGYGTEVSGGICKGTPKCLNNHQLQQRGQAEPAGGVGYGLQHRGGCTTCKWSVLKQQAQHEHTALDQNGRANASP